VKRDLVVGFEVNLRAIRGDQLPHSLVQFLAERLRRRPEVGPGAPILEHKLSFMFEGFFMAGAEHRE
jgi:hypothetical protein